MKRSLISLALLAAAAVQAQSVDYHLQNSGATYNRVETSASVTGVGTSLSVAYGAQSSFAGGLVSSVATPGGRALVLAGAVETRGSGYASNMSTGAGTGFATSVGWADAEVRGHNNFSNQNGTLTMGGYTDSGMGVRNGRGVDINVSAGTGQSAWAAGADGGAFFGQGYTFNLGGKIGAQVSDVKFSHSVAEAAGGHANSGNVTEFSAHFVDPIGN